MGLATFHGPHLLILDEPTNHLDIDSRAALIEALNDYQGAVILVSHDRYLLEACADRLWLVDQGTVKAFPGDMDDYKKHVLEKAGAATSGKSASKATAKTNDDTAPVKPAAPRPAKAAAPLKKRLSAAEDKMARFQMLITKVDAALADPDAFIIDPAKAAQLAKQRGELAKALAAAEEEWLDLSSEVEAG
jgi:ATP-binding cassette, subfamily F, member 3